MPDRLSSCHLCRAEFAALIPIAGSAYTYSDATLGGLVAWIIGWDLILGYTVGSVTVAVGWHRLGFIVYFGYSCHHSKLFKTKGSD